MTAVAPKKLDSVREPEPAKIVAAYANQLYRTALLMGLPGEAAEEVMQDVLAEFLMRDAEEAGAPVRTTLFGILFQALSAFYPDLTETGTIDDGGAPELDTGTHWIREPEKIQRLLETEEVGGQIQRCVAGLPLLERFIFRLRVVEGMPTEEIRQALRITQGDCARLMNRAYARLWVCLVDLLDPIRV